MKIRSTVAALFGAVILMAITGCKDAPGKPKAGDEAQRPEQVKDFATLYGSNCAACHGARGVGGASISLANPVYLAFAGYDTIAGVTAKGVPGSLMPGFGKQAGGALTDEQISILAHGMIDGWGNAQALGGQPAPAYASSTAGDGSHGKQAFGTFCARCHGSDGAGNPDKHVGSLVEPAYLALVSNQSLRSTIVAGRPADGMPDWRSDLAGHAMTDQEITDTVAWLASGRSATPGQPYQQHQ